MLNFQNQDCKLSLQEGIEEYRSYLRKNDRHVLGEQVSDSEKWGILCHDATHVVFGLDTTLEEEAMLDCWVFFGGNNFQALKDYFSGKIDFKETKVRLSIQELSQAAILRFLGASWLAEGGSWAILSSKLRPKIDQNRCQDAFPS